MYMSHLHQQLQLKPVQYQAQPESTTPNLFTNIKFLPKDSFIRHTCTTEKLSLSSSNQYMTVKLENPTQIQ